MVGYTMSYRKNQKKVVILQLILSNGANNLYTISRSKTTRS